MLRSKLFWIVVFPASCFAQTPRGMPYIPPPQMNLDNIPITGGIASDALDVYRQKKVTTTNRPATQHTDDPRHIIFNGMTSNGVIFSGTGTSHGGLTNFQGLDSSGNLINKTCGLAGCF